MKRDIRSAETKDDEWITNTKVAGFLMRYVQKIEIRTLIITMICVVGMCGQFFIHKNVYRGEHKINFLLPVTVRIYVVKEKEYLLNIRFLYYSNICFNQCLRAKAD